MTTEIPTAEEFWDKNLYKKSPVQIMKEFAKLHCIEQAKAICKNVDNENYGQSVIKNAYDLDNIK